ncbi:MAG: hypothetical protein AAF679_14855 [Pseudomonadota bacterium]
MAVFRCFRPNGDWDNLETDHESLDELWADLSEKGSIFGQILDSKRTSERGVREVIGRRPVIVSARAYTLIEDPTVRFVEYEEEE